MKVLHVMPAVAPRYGGPSASIVGMCRALRIRGIDVMLATTDADGSGRLAVAVGRPTTHEGIPTIFFPRQASEAFKYSLPLARWLGAEVGKFDLVHVHAVFSHSSLSASRAARRARVPYVLRPMNHLHPMSLAHGRVRKTIARWLYADRMIACASALHFTADAEMEDTRASVKFDRGFVVPLGYDAEGPVASSGRSTNPSLPPAGAPYALVLGRLHRIKRIERLLEAFEAVADLDAVCAWHVVVAGSGDAEYEAYLRQIGARERLRGRVWFTGWLEGADKQRVLNGAKLFVQLSTHENFGVALLESLHAGVPAVVSDGIGLAEAVRRADAGWVADDETSLPELLSEVMSRPEELQRRAKAAVALAAAYSWDRVGAALVDAYRGVLSLRMETQG